MNNTTATLTITSTALARALSRMPKTSTAVTAAMISTAGKLNHGWPAMPSTGVNGSEQSTGDTRGSPSTARNSFK